MTTTNPKIVEVFGLLGYAPGSIELILGEVWDERHRQDAKWGEQNYPDGTHEDYADERDSFRDKCNWHASVDEISWSDILLKETYEALAETDRTKLRTELIQIAAVAVCWIEAIDRRSMRG